jgi:hypothetical protein
MRVIAIANDGVQKRAQDSHSAFNEEKRFEPEGGACGQERRRGWGMFSVTAFP